MVQRDIVLLLGAPGSGKGTQARFLTSILGVPHVASGDLLREHRRLATPLGQAAQAFMDRGDLVPDELVVDMIGARLARRDADRGVLLDGFPRTRAQAEALDRRLAELGTTVRAALYLDVPPAVLIDRLAGRWMCQACQATYHVQFAQPQVTGRCDVCAEPLYQRPDDERQIVENRVAVYLRDTVPVIDHYTRLGHLRRIDGHQEIHEVRAELCAGLGGTTKGARRQRWHLFTAHAAALHGNAVGRTLCGKLVSAHHESGSLLAFFDNPCHRCRRAVAPHRMKPAELAIG